MNKKEEEICIDDTSIKIPTHYLSIPQTIVNIFLSSAKKKINLKEYLSARAWI